jgi:hypothetical protein
VVLSVRGAARDVAGWRLDHPIGKMALFQAHVHAKRM